MQDQAIFTVRTADDFFVQIVRPQHQEFVENNSSARHALLSIITAYHLGEWVYGEEWGDKSKIWKPAAQHAGVADDFEIARRLTNGTKHSNIKISTRVQAGFSSAFSYAFARSLVITVDKNETSADELLDRLMDFWETQKKLGVF